MNIAEKINFMECAVDKKVEYAINQAKGFRNNDDTITLILADGSEWDAPYNAHVVDYIERQFKDMA